MTLCVREATIADLQAVLQLYAQPDMDQGKVLPLDKAEQVWKQFARYPNYRLYVACPDHQPDQVLGSYALLVMHNLAHSGTPSAIVEDVVVHPAHQGQGIGRLMMADAMSHAQRAGCYKLVLSSNQRRERAHAFYESLGFQRHGYSFLIDLK
jgi:ribosomal protein S18 acetylase RimI-like enzyme